MPLPGDDNTFGKRKGSYTPGADLDSTPFKPVPMAFQQADGTLPMNDLDRNANAKGANPQRQPIGGNRNRQSQSNKKKYCLIALIILLTILIILAIVLPLAICLGTDLCSGSSSSSAHKGHRIHQVRMTGTLSAPIIPDPGHAPFNEHLNTTLESIGSSTTVNSTLETTTKNGTNVTSTEPTANISTITLQRQKREVNTTANMTSEFGNTTTPISFIDYQPTPIDQYLLEKINEPLLQSIKSSSLCQQIDCSQIIFDHIKLEDNFLISRFDLTVDHDLPITIDPPVIFDVIESTKKNFSGTFAELFPGYHLGDIDLSFDLHSLCAHDFIQCYDIPGINDTWPTTTNDYTSSLETSTISDRSILLPDLVQIFNVTISDSNTTETTTSTHFSNVSTLSSSSSSTGTSTILRPTTIPAILGMVNCSSFGFLCANQKDRVGTLQRCDGILQCPDGSDEEQCNQCRTSFSCPNGAGDWLCMRGQILCDNDTICPTKVDESPLFCKNSCLSSEYGCKESDICIPRSWLCDGDQQCPHGDDEIDCLLPSKCNNNAFYCSADQRCIGSWNVCNGVDDCSDGADEARCSCVECSSSTTALCSTPNGKCIQKKQLCDGKNDCPNGEDEINCKP